MISFNRASAAIFAAGALSFALPALASDVSYPRVVGTGMNLMIEYGPTGNQNIVGGGDAMASTNSNGEVQVTYGTDRINQPARPGLRPVVVGSGNNVSVIYVPVENAPVALGQATARPAG